MPRPGGAHRGAQLPAAVTGGGGGGTRTLLVWGPEDVAAVIQAAAVETGIEGLRVLCPVFSRPGHPRRQRLVGGWLMGGSGLTGAEASGQQDRGGVPGQGRVSAGGRGHLLVGEHSGDAAVSGSKHGQETVPGGSGEVRAQAAFPRPIPASRPHSPCGRCLRVEILVPPHALHQLLGDAGVQDQVVQKEVVA